MPDVLVLDPSSNPSAAGVVTPAPAPASGGLALHARLKGLAGAVHELPLPVVGRPRREPAAATVGRTLAELCRDEVQILGARALPDDEGVVDHLVVGPTGAWLIAAHSVRGRVVVRRPSFGPSRLLIGGRDAGHLADRLSRQIDAVAAELRGLDPTFPVHAALCLIGGVLPVVGTTTCQGLPLVHGGAAARLVNADGPLRPAQVRAASRRLRERLEAR